LARIDHRDRADRTEPTESVDPPDSAERNEPTDPTDRADPIDPTLSTDPTEPIDRIDPRLAIERNEPSDHRLRSRTPPILTRPADARHLRSPPPRLVRARAGVLSQMLSDPRGGRMRGIGFARHDGATTVEGYGAPTCSLRGQASSSLVAFDGFPLWAVRGRLSPGSSLGWEAHHGDEGLYVVAGTLRVGGQVCPSGGALVIEAGTPATAIADDGASVVHFGPHDPEPPREGIYGPPAAEPRGVHVVGPGGTYAAVEPGRETRMFADSTCPTCRITLFFTGRDAEYASARHSHSADEILYLLRGDVRFGSQRVGPHDAVAIEGGHRYGFRSGPEGFAFLNYRRDASEQTTVGGVPMLEGGRARALTPVNDVR
jgi:quercetin dioxygenase-like cupin family protein